MRKTLATAIAVLSTAAGGAVGAVGAVQAGVPHPLVADPVGDAPSAAIDIVSGDVQADASGFTVTMRLDDLPTDAQLGALSSFPGTPTQYDVQLGYDGGTDDWFDLTLRRAADGRVEAKAEYHSIREEAPAYDVTGTTWTLDPAANTVSFHLRYSAVNAVLSSLGEPAIGLGSVVDAVFMSKNGVLGPPVAAGAWGNDATAWTGAYSLGD